MMLLGLVLHSAITYRAFIELNWGLQDTAAAHPLNDCVVIFIHTFRIPVFFVIAGFFGALLFYERGPGPMARNRWLRIFLPFVVFLFIVNLLNVFAFSFSSYMLGADRPSPLPPANPLILIPRRTGHLWFLYYLCYITVAAMLLAMAARRLPTLTAACQRRLHPLFGRPFRALPVFAAGTALILWASRTIEVGTSTSAIPNPATLLFYGYLYFVGWLLYHSKDCLNNLTRRCWPMLGLGTALVLVKLYFYLVLAIDPHTPGLLLIALNALSIWALILGFIGLFVRYLSEPSAALRYTSDASYWIYLIHLPIAAFIPGLIAGWAASGYVKSVLVLAVTTAISLATYHLFVRSTFVGQFLNGRKYPKRPL